MCDLSLGGIGIDFLNRSLIGPIPDPMRTQILLYELAGDTLRLIAAEWFILLATGVQERPALLGQPFDGPMKGHEPLLPVDLHHYDLDVWLFKPNPAGLFQAALHNKSVLWLICCRFHALTISSLLLILSYCAKPFQAQMLERIKGMARDTGRDPAAQCTECLHGPRGGAL